MRCIICSATRTCRSRSCNASASSAAAPPAIPSIGHALGIETTTGPLGQGIATAVGMALAERMLAARFGAELVDHYTYVIAGDGCLQEGISHEAIDLAGHLRLSRLIVFWDDNSISIDGPTSLSTSMDQPARFRAAGWHVIEVDGHDMEAVASAIEAARHTDRPSLIACKTVIGKGAPNLGGSEKTHGAPLGDAEIAATRENIGWPHAPFEVPREIVSAWRAAAARGRTARRLGGAAGGVAAARGLRRTRSPASCPPRSSRRLTLSARSMSRRRPRSPPARPPRWRSA